MIGTAHTGNAINVQTITFTGAQVPTLSDALRAPSPPAPPCRGPSVQFFDPDFENPEVHQASVGVERALGDRRRGGGRATCSWPGASWPSRATSTSARRCPPRSPSRAGAASTVDRFPTRPFTNFDRLVRFESTGRSNYNGATVELKKRFSGGFLGNLAYTLGKVKDNNPDSVNVVLGGGDDARFPSDPVDRDADYAHGQNDVRHRLVLSGYWDLGYFKDSGRAAARRSSTAGR